MTVLLPALAVAFAAFCVWLGVRIVNRRERWAKWTAVGLLFALPAFYVLSFGPACWVASRTGLGASSLPVLYRPIIWGMAKDDRVYRSLNSYAEFGADRDWHWVDVGGTKNFVWMDLSGLPFIGIRTL